MHESYKLVLFGVLRNDHNEVGDEDAEVCNCGYYLKEKEVSLVQSMRLCCNFFKFVLLSSQVWLNVPIEWFTVDNSIYKQVKLHISFVVWIGGSRGFKISQGSREDVVKGHEDGGCPIVGKVAREEYDHEAVAKGYKSRTDKHWDCEACEEPLVPEPVAKCKEHEE